MPDTILISLASYRDPELIPTIRDCLAQARDPSRLRFAVGWQHGAPKPDGTYYPGDEPLPKEWVDSDQFCIIDVPHTDTQGVCWMRSLLQQQWAGETYFMQLDSHHRFAKNWDDLAVRTYSDLVATGVEKPLLTAYASSFNPANDPAERTPFPYQMNFERFTPEGVVFFRPGEMLNWHALRFAQPARFFSAHFAFAAGAFCREVPYDPNYWFHGEEINMGVRAFTHGYDLFHPHKIIVWHEFTRRGRTKVWDDNEPWEKDRWGKANNATHIRNRKLFGMDGEAQDIDFGPLGFGPRRALADWERYAGVKFSNRSVQRWTLDFKPPPSPQHFDTPEAYDKSWLRFVKHCIDIHWKGGQLDDFDFWAVTFHNAKGEEIFRKDADEKEIQSFKGDPDNYCKVWREFFADPNNPPVKWIVRPHSKTLPGGWCPILEGPIR